MSPIQQMLLGVGAVATKTYVDDVFSTYLWEGNESARSINNGINLSESGGMVWVKNREVGFNHTLQDTERGAGATKKICSNLTNGQNDGTDTGATWAGYISAFNNNGFSLDKSGSNAPYNWVNFNRDNEDYVSWTFRQAPGCFDVVTYTGNGSARTIAHSLGCVPGCVMIKCTSTAKDWCVWHRGATVSTPGNVLYLNLTDTAEDTGSIFNDTAPTASVFTVETGGKVNENGETYVAYLFGGGESTAATARSVDFDGSDDDLATTLSTAPGTSDFTLEYWAKQDTLTNWQTHFATTRGNGFNVGTDGSGDFVFFTSLGGGRTIEKIGVVPIGQWNHWAFVRTGGVTTGYLNGVAQGSFSDSYNYTPTAAKIGNLVSGNEYTNGSISNLRLVVGTAVYTSSFRPPTEPLTSITNTVLLCCNNSSVTGKTTGGTITANGSPTASTDSPFDDPAAFTFGDSKEGIIKCGSYVGDGANPGVDVNIGFEPQFIMIKRTDTAANWAMVDSMRGITTRGSDKFLFPNLTNADQTSTYISLTSTGFQLHDGNFLNQSGASYIYLAIRRPDGYVGKPPELGTGVLSIATGTNNTNPGFVSGFPVDFSLRRPYESSSSWYAASRLTGPNYLVTDGNGSQASNSNQTFDFQNGIGKWGGDLTSWMSWQWKRHAGFDVVTWTGDGVHGRKIPHSLNNTAQMLWIKRRSGVNAWATGHIGLNGGTNPWNYYVGINETSQETDDDGMFADTAPTSTHFTTGAHSQVNSSSETYIAMLFASANDIDGNPISKVGYYTGDGTSNRVITTGFQPRFLLLRQVNVTQRWFVLDTVRGWASGNDEYLELNTSDAQEDYDFGIPTSNGFTPLNVGNTSNGKYIYYAHA